MWRIVALFSCLLLCPAVGQTHANSSWRYDQGVSNQTATRNAPRVHKPPNKFKSGTPASCTTGRDLAGQQVYGVFGSIYSPDDNFFFDPHYNALASVNQQPALISDSNTYEFGFEGLTSSATGDNFYLDVTSCGVITLFGNKGQIGTRPFTLTSAGFVDATSITLVSSNANVTYDLNNDTVTLVLTYDDTYDNFTATYQLEGICFVPDGTICRPAASHCDQPEKCSNGQRPPDANTQNFAPCPWFPKNHRVWSADAYSVDASSAKMAKASEQEAQALLRAAPSYLEEWPPCEGNCIDGLCVLRWDHPACCIIDKATHYEGMEQQYAGMAAHGYGHHGHWEGPELYCWDV